MMRAGDKEAGMDVDRPTMLTHDALMHPNAPALLIARQLLRFRRRIAPPSSRRERVLRSMYLPIVRLLQRREVMAGRGRPPEARVVAMPNLRARAAEWPERPRILILKLDHLGDFIVAMPALARIREAFPKAHITLVCASWNAAWAERSGLADSVVVFDFFAKTKADWQGATAEHLERFAALRLGRHDLAIDLRHDPDTRPLLARVDAATRVGFAAPLDLDGGCLDLSLPNMEHVSVAAGTGRPVHAELRLDILAATVIATFAAPPHPVRVLVEGGAVGKAEAGKAGAVKAGAVEPVERAFAILAPGAGSPIRVWPIDRLAAVGRALIDRHGLDIVLIGGPGQLADCTSIAGMLPPDRVRNLASKVPLDDLPSLIGRARLLVGYDTGTSHLAASLGIPTVSVMGGIADPEVWRVDGARAIAIVSQIACGHCYLTHAAECPFGVRCQTAITAEHVLAACEALLVPKAAHSPVLPTA